MHPTPPPPDWSRLLRPGSRIFLGAGACCPLALVEDLLRHARRHNDLEFFHGLTLGPSPWTDPAHAAHLGVNAFFLDPRLSALVNAGMDDYTPVHHADLPALFAERVIRIDVALVMVSPPDQFGYCSLGTSVDLIPAALGAAKVVVAQINPRMPRVHGLGFVPLARFHAAITAEAELPELPALEAGADHEALGSHVAQLVRDGDTLQAGVGPVGSSVLRALRGHRHLGLHTELIGDAAMELFLAGVIDNSRKTLLPGKAVGATALGSRQLYAFLHDNPHFELRPTEFINSPLTIARNDHLVAVTSALEVDLTGQVAVDSVRGSFRSGLGSHVDFLRGAAMSRGGRPIVALTSVGVDASGQRYSRIRAQLSAWAGVGCNRADVHYIVTEQGIATLRGRTIRERVLELIQVAHPDFREDLLREAREHNLVPAYYRLPAPYPAGEGPLGPRRLHLADGTDYLLRPLTPADERRLQEFFYSHTEETIARRYGHVITRMSRERANQLVGVDQTRDLALGIFELPGPFQTIRAVGRYYLDQDGGGAEMAFVVAENKRRLGMARTLLSRMLEIATARGVSHLWAQVDPNNLAMLRLFQSFGCREAPGDEPGSLRVRIPAASR